MPPRYLILFFIIAGVLGFGVQVSGQRPQGAGRPGGSNTSATPQVERDSFIYRYLYATQRGQVFEYTDTSLNQFHRYDPARIPWAEYANLGNTGSASRPLILTPNISTGFNMGFEQYKVYNFTVDSFRFYDSNRSLSDLFFTPVGGQQNFVVGADFSTQFADGWSTSLNYFRINQPGFYTRQNIKHTNFGIGLRYAPKNKNRETYILLLSNVNMETHNGGVQESVNFNQPFRNIRTSIPVNLEDAQTRYDQKQLSVINYFQFGKAQAGKESLSIYHRFDWESSTYHYFDRNLTSSLDTLVYRDFVIDERGIRYFTKVNRVSNSFFADLSGGIFPEMRAGITHDLFFISEESTSNIRNDLTLQANASIPFLKKYFLRSSGALGVGSNVGNFHFTGAALAKPSEWINLEAGLELYRTEPGLIFRRMRLNNQLFFINDFSNPVGSLLKGTFSIPRLKSSITFKQLIENNSLAWNADRLPVQLDNVLSMQSIEIRQDFSLGPIGLENFAFLQNINTEVYGLPSFYSRHNLFIEGYLFKKAMQFRLGAESRLIPGFNANRFFPLTGAFYHDQEQISFYPAIDAYFMGKISRFRFFVRLENLSDLWTNDINFLTPFYPQFDFNLRLGVRWLLLD
jgi:hypothetical protein